MSERERWAVLRAFADWAGEDGIRREEFAQYRILSIRGLSGDSGHFFYFGSEN